MIAEKRHFEFSQGLNENTLLSNLIFNEDKMYSRAYSIIIE